MQIESIAEICNSFDLHLATIYHYHLCFVYFEWPLKTGFTVYQYFVYASSKGICKSSICAGSAEPSLLNNAIYSKLTCAVSNASLGVIQNEVQKIILKSISL